MGGQHPAETLAAISRWLDESPAYADCDPETVLWRRVTKVAAESGEAIDALAGVVGENPRKGITHNWEDLTGELLDVAVAALGAVEHITGNDGESWRLLTEKIARVAERAGLPPDAHPCGHQRSAPGCGGCDPGAVAAVMDDSRPGIWRSPQPDDFAPTAPTEPPQGGRRMSAETLRRAADLMRERAKAAICPCGGPVCNVEQGWFGSAELTVRLDSAGAAQHAAHWSPRTALAVADVLDKIATFHYLLPAVIRLPAHAVARAYLGVAACKACKRAAWRASRAGAAPPPHGG